MQLLSKHGLDAHLRPGMGNTLFALFRNDGLSVSALAAEAGLALATVSEVIKRMEKAGIVRRERPARDARVSLIHLTELGRGLEGRCRKLNSELVKIMTAGLPDDHARMTVLHLGTISRNLSNRLKHETQVHP